MWCVMLGLIYVDCIHQEARRTSAPSNRLAARGCEGVGQGLESASAVIALGDLELIALGKLLYKYSRRLVLEGRHDQVLWEHVTKVFLAYVVFDRSLHILICVDLKKKDKGEYEITGVREGKIVGGMPERILNVPRLGKLVHRVAAKAVDVRIDNRRGPGSVSFLINWSMDLWWENDPGTACYFMPTCRFVWLSDQPRTRSFEFWEIVLKEFAVP